MDEQGDRPRFIERTEPARTPEESRQRRANAMLGIGVIAFVVGVLGVSGGSGAALLIGLLGALLLVAGLVTRS